MARTDPRPKGQKLDREIYARARGADNLPRTKAAKLAGSEAKGSRALSDIGARVEMEPEVQRMIAQFRELRIRSMEDAWEKAKARMEQLLDHGDWKARRAAAEFFGRAGGYVTRHQHEGPEVITIQAILEARSKKALPPVVEADAEVVDE